MNGIVAQALAAWGLEGAEVSFVAARENKIYRVARGDTEIALRLHREAYRTDTELQSELDWMAEVACSGIAVPAPVPARNGAFLVRIDDVQVDALTWLAGDTLEEILSTLGQSRRATLFFELGRQMAQLHHVSDAWQRPTGFKRAHWDRDGLLGDAPLWDRFWENPGLGPEDRDLLRSFRRKATDALAVNDGERDYGLIHADLVAGNVLVESDMLKFIDFDDGGFGFRLFDVATALLKHDMADDFSQLQCALIDGYRSVRALDLGELDLFLALRSVTYVGWNITRSHEQNGPERNHRFIARARRWVGRYMSP